MINYGDRFRGMSLDPEKVFFHVRGIDAQKERRVRFSVNGYVVDAAACFVAEHAISDSAGPEARDGAGEELLRTLDGSRTRNFDLAHMGFRHSFVSMHFVEELTPV